MLTDIDTEDLALFWRGRARALRALYEAASPAARQDATLRSAETYEECANELQAALARRSQPTNSLAANDKQKLEWQAQKIAELDDECQLLRAQLSSQPVTSRAVNAHDDLVKALGESVSHFRDAQSGFISGCIADQEWEKTAERILTEARAALAKVRSQPVQDPNQ